MSHYGNCLGITNMVIIPVFENVSGKFNVVGIRGSGTYTQKYV